MVVSYHGRSMKPACHVTEVKAASFAALDCGANPRVQGRDPCERGHFRWKIPSHHRQGRRTSGSEARRKADLYDQRWHRSVTASQGIDAVDPKQRNACRTSRLRVALQAAVPMAGGEGSPGSLLQVSFLLWG
ncbi:hypothetical protein HNQ96_004271 [Aminobacter lissarensis]|uniref:Uncharacterized protein n=1 Tax=Aminobacter carboxidus TaxID=376165 RepID=A0A8E1WJQ8_9HYPH|nr:hypothetical protein [Aminobacter lissarensis]MBB6468387.1 hypothetical protein [Aminobacter lissarensis]